MYYPLNYQQINWTEGRYSPSTVKNYNNYAFAFWERNLFQRLISVIDFKLPTDWQGSTADFFYYVLFRNGFVCISKNDEFGQFFQPCTISGFNFYYQPVRAVIANPKYSAQLTIGENCELLKLTPDFTGVWDIITYYAEKLAILESAINMNAINSKLAYIVTGKNKAAIESLKQMMDAINRGNPTVFIDNRLTNDRTDDALPIDLYTVQKIKENYILGDLLRDFQTILNNFNEEIGIQSIPYEKKERMTKYESESRLESSLCKLRVWEKSLESSLTAVKALYPDLELSYTINYGGGENGASGENNPDRNV